MDIDYAIIDIDEVARELYSFLPSRATAPWSGDPTDYSRVQGLIDLHVHAHGGGSQSAYHLGKHASRAGMRALVLESDGQSVDVACVVNECLAEWGAANGVKPTQIIGTMKMGRNTGGLNPEFAAKMIAKGARVVFLPSDSAKWIAWYYKIPLDEAKTRGVYVLDGDHIVPEMEEILELVKETGVALSFNHLSKEEWFALADECQSRGITRVFGDHPFAPAAGISAEELAELAGRGVTTNFTYWELSPYCSIPARTMVDAIRRIGADWVTLSSDSGSEFYSGSVEAMRMHSAMLDVYGFSAEDQRKILCGNQARLLGLEAAG
jgi:hypothetical protein